MASLVGALILGASWFVKKGIDAYHRRHYQDDSSDYETAVKNSKISVEDYHDKPQDTELVHSSKSKTQKFKTIFHKRKEGPIPTAQDGMLHSSL